MVNPNKFIRDDLVFETTKVVVTGVPVEYNIAALKPHLPVSEHVSNINLLAPNRVIILPSLGFIAQILKQPARRQGGDTSKFGLTSNLNVFVLMLKLVLVVLLWKTNIIL